MKCSKGLEVGVLYSNAGFYVGTKSELGEPNCRISGYSSGSERAKSLPLDRQDALENKFCNGCGKCFGDKATRYSSLSDLESGSEDTFKVTFDDALYCAKALASQVQCEECRIYELCHIFCEDAYQMIVDAMEEVRRYRAIGTVEQFEELMKAKGSN